MSRVAYFSTTLPWTSDPGDDRRFLRIISTTMIITLFLGVGVPLVDLPDIVFPLKEKKKVQVVKLVLTKPEPVKKVVKKKPPVKPVPKVVTPKPKPKPVVKKAKKKPEVKKAVKTSKIKKSPVKKTVASKTVKSKKKPVKRSVESMGLLAFADDLSSIKKTASSASVSRNNRLQTVSNEKRKKSTRSIVTAALTKGSGGIKSTGLSRNASTTRLEERRITQLEGIPANTVSSSVSGKSTGAIRASGRSSEEIQFVFDKNKGSIFTLYNRELRKDPGLRGKVIVELTITPSGKVKTCRVISTQLNNSALEKKLLARIKSFKFESRDVDTVVATYPIDFLPS